LLLSSFNTRYRFKGFLGISRSLWRIALCGAGLLFLLSGCGYRLAGSAGNHLAPGQNLWVSFIKNESISPTAQTVIRRALLEEGHAMRGLAPAANKDDAELLIDGSLRSYTLRAISYTSIDQVKEYRLTIDVELELRRKGAAVPLWKGTLQSFRDYPANILNLSLQRNAEEAALMAASHIIAQKFLTAVENSY
jgi:outer membrane lipopolysaccharide assembly protein LptE/RlpB